MKLAAILSAFGLSSAAGLNAYIPLLLIAVLGRIGLVHLSEPYDVLTSTWAIVVIGVLLVVEVIVDKVPGADHVNDVIQTVVRPTAGAVLFACSSGVIGETHPAVALTAGLVLALGVHATKAAARPVVNASTLGLGAPVVSTIEDIVSAVASVTAVALPLLIGLFAVLLLVFAWWVWTRRRRLRTARKPAAPRPGP